jgi:hypothetical protein
MENKNITKALLIASFVKKQKIDWFFTYLNDKFGIDKKEVFIYEVEDNNTDYLLTFKIKSEERIDFKFHFSNATIVNFKNGCVFSINGMNKLIESTENCEIGNTNHKNYKVNWENYRGNLILSSKNKLSIKKIKKIDNSSLK